MTVNDIREELLNSLSFVPNLQTVAIYGSCTYKEFAQARDIDVFAVFRHDTFCTGRVDVLFEKINKRASVYLLNERDLLDDIAEQKFGAKLTTFFFHGYVSLENENRCYQYYVMAMQSLIKTFDFTLYQDPAAFFKYANLQMYKYSSIFYKSGLDFYTYAALRELNYCLYKRSYAAFLGDKKEYRKNPNLPKAAQQFVHFFRTTNAEMITKIHKKRRDMRQRMEEHRQLLVKEYGEEEYDRLLQAFERIGATLAEVEQEGLPNLPFVCYPLISVCA